ncbi:hypothetical protein CXF93_02965 [Moritella sp. Urea-trap-13]|nr:hypothetical protein CXF93_02965 [Moritella sp. Urea-trap-13]
MMPFNLAATNNANKRMLIFIRSLNKYGFLGRRCRNIYKKKGGDSIPILKLFLVKTSGIGIDVISYLLAYQ